MSKAYPIVVLLIGVVFFTLDASEGRCESSWLHVSALLNHEFTESYSPGYNINIFFGNTWGYRYSQIPEVKFIAESIVDTGVGRITILDAKADFVTQMVVRTIDYRTFPQTGAHPFSFLTAYFAAGYSEIPIEVSMRSYVVNNSKLSLVAQEISVNSAVYAAAFGLYGGERFFVIDAHLLYFYGNIEDRNYLSEPMKFDHWLIIFGLGVGF